MKKFEINYKQITALHSTKSNLTTKKSYSSFTNGKNHIERETKLFIVMRWLGTETNCGQHTFSFSRF